MKDSKINYGLIIFIGVIVLLFLPIISDFIKNQKVVVLNNEELVKIIEKAEESFILYIGKPDKDITKELKKIKDKKTNEYSYVYSVYSIEDSEKVDELFGKDTEVVFVIEGDLQKTFNKYDYNTVEKYADIYLVGNINDSNRAYKVAESFNEYKSIVKSDEVTMAVFGYSGCYHCNVFKTVYNAVADKYNLDIYYFDSSIYDKDEYTKIINMDLTIPGKCQNSGEDFKLSDGFGTPLIIFTQKGKVVDCVGGRLSRDRLISKLKSLEMISE